MWWAILSIWHVLYIIINFNKLLLHSLNFHWNIVTCRLPKNNKKKVKWKSDQPLTTATWPITRNAPKKREWSLQRSMSHILNHLHSRTLHINNFLFSNNENNWYDLQKYRDEEKPNYNWLQTKTIFRSFLNRSYALPQLETTTKSSDLMKILDCRESLESPDLLLKVAGVR